MSKDGAPGLLDRFCVRCGEKLAPERQRNTSFHNQACKQAWYRAKQRTHASEDLAYTEQQFRHCRGHAHWYRLAILIDKIVWRYPPLGQPSIRFDGLLRATPGFRVEPYEPPVVPQKGRYSVFLFDADGHPVRSVEGCLLVRADPLWQVPVESGDRDSEP